jgi:hypothetical protein
MKNLYEIVEVTHTTMLEILVFQSVYFKINLKGESLDLKQ